MHHTRQMIVDAIQGSEHLAVRLAQEDTAWNPTHGYATQHPNFHLRGPGMATYRRRLSPLLSAGLDLAAFDPLADDGDPRCDAINPVGGVCRLVAGDHLAHYWGEPDESAPPGAGGEAMSETEVEFAPGCVGGAGFIACGPGGVTIRERGKCRGLCEKPDARLIVREPNSGYYAPTVTCECGDTWDMEEGLFQRPFERGWRAKAQARFEASWESALPEGTQTVRDDEQGWLTGVVLPDGTEVSR